MKRWYKLAALVAGVATLAGVGASARVADAPTPASVATPATSAASLYHRFMCPPLDEFEST